MASDAVTGALTGAPGGAPGGRPAGAPAGAPLARTPLHALHHRLGAAMVGCAGTALPAHYPAGRLAEHRAARHAAALFDVSHLGQFALPAAAAAALETVLASDILGLAANRQRYCLMTNDAGGIAGDLTVARVGGRLLLVVDAARLDRDAAPLRAALPAGLDLTVLDRALLALQGPVAADILAALAPGAAGMAFLEAREMAVAGIACVVSRSGYTGEDGFEIAAPAAQAEALACALLADPRVLPAGLGARESLRLEAGLCRYGADIDAETTPSEAALAWSIPPVRRAGGARAGGFAGAGPILAELARGPSRRRVGLRAAGPLPVGAGARIFATAGPEAPPVGVITSAGFGPTVQAPVAMGLVATSSSALGTLLFAEQGATLAPLAVTPLPFVARKHRGG